MRKSYIPRLHTSTEYMPGCISHPWQVHTVLGRSHLTVFPPCYPSFLETPLLSHSPLLLPGVWSDSCFAGGLGALEYGGSLTGHRSSFVFRTPYCYPNTLSIYNNTTDYIPYRVYRVALWYYGESRNTYPLPSQCSCRESRPYHDLNSNWQ